MRLRKVLSNKLKNSEYGDGDTGYSDINMGKRRMKRASERESLKK